MSNQLLTAPVRPLILRIALPSMIAMVASALSALLDALLLGRLGAQLTAAASVSFPLLSCIQTLGFTLGMGAGSFVSRCLGSGNPRAAQTAASTALFLALSVSLLLCGAGALLAAPLCRLLGAGSELISPAAAYARYVLLSGPLLCTSLVLSSLLRAQGKTLPNLFAFGSGAAAVIPLQFLLIARLGVHGAGVSMLIREAIALIILVVCSLRSKHLVLPSPRSFSLRPQVLGDIMRSGAPTLLRQGVASLSAALLTRAAAAFGPSALAGMGLSARVLNLLSAATIGFGQGFQPVCGAAFGAGLADRIRDAYRFSMLSILLALTGAGAMLFLFAGDVLYVLLADVQAFEVAKSALRAQSITLFAQGAVIMMNMLTQAMGMTLRSSIVATSRQGFVFIPMLFLLVRLFGLRGLILCQSASDLLSAALCLLVTRSAIRDCGCERGGYSDARTGSR